MSWFKEGLMNANLKIFIPRQNSNLFFMSRSVNFSSAKPYWYRFVKIVLKVNSTKHLQDCW